MLGKKLINLSSNMFALANYSAMSLVIPFATPLVIPPALVIFTLFTLAAFIKYKNLVLETLILAIGSHMPTDSAFII